MKILHITDSSSIGGMETQVISLAKQLLLDEYEVCAISSNKVLGDILFKYKINHYTLPVLLILKPREILKIPQYLFSLIGIILVVKKEKVDLIHSHAPSSSSVLSFIVSKTLRVPLIYTVHYPAHVRIFSKFLKFIGYRCDAVIAVSHECENYLKSILEIKNENIYTIYNGISLDCFNSIDKMLDLEVNNKKKIIHIARLDPDKSIATLKLIDAMPVIASIIPDVLLIIVGDGLDYNKLFARANEINKKFNKELIKMVGFVDPANIASYLMESDVVLGAGRVAIEGIVCKKPVIFISPNGIGTVFNESDWKKIKYSNFSGRGCKSDYSSSDIASYILKLFNDTDLYHNSEELMGELAKEFDIRIKANEIGRVYKLCVNKHLQENIDKEI